MATPSGASARETEPLLPAPSLPKPYPATGEVPIASEDPTFSDVPDKRVTWSTIILRVIFAAYNGLIIAAGIQAYLNADDDSGSGFDLRKALMAALGGGLSGAAAMVLQVATLMPLRTIMNYQYRFGTTFLQAGRILYADGGYFRYYQGVGPALFQAPVSRFGDTAANQGILALLSSNPFLSRLPIPIQTVFASLCAAEFRMILTPVDTLKTTLQTQGTDGWRILRVRIKKYGLGSLWYGAFATAAATLVGHYPWFSTYNYLNKNLPLADGFYQKLARQAIIGFAASLISDCVSNSIRVVKTYRQVNETRISYTDAARAVIASDGLLGLFTRGLRTRILTNALQSILFSILWKTFLDIWDDKTSKA